MILKYLYFIERRNKAYFLRVQISVICSLIFFILLFRLWPLHPDETRQPDHHFSHEKTLTPDMIEALQEVRVVDRSSPPVPRPGITAPSDEIVDMTYDLELEGTAPGIAPGNTFGPFPKNEHEEAELVEHPDQPPRVRHIVEPVMPSQARRDGLRVEIEVLYIVSEKGEVEEVTIEEMQIFNPETGSFETVDETGYGFREITLRAARQWLFHPAQYEGQPVRSKTRQRFTFGRS